MTTTKQGPLYMMMYKEDAGKSSKIEVTNSILKVIHSITTQDRSIDLGSFLATYPELKPFFKEKFVTFMGKDYGKQVQLRYPNDKYI